MSAVKTCVSHNRTNKLNLPYPHHVQLPATNDACDHNQIGA